MTETLFDSVARARAADPETSHAAAASISSDDLSQQKKEILAVLSIYGPLTDESMIEVYRSAYPHSTFTDQSLRSRRKSLERDGKVRFAGEWGRTNTGAKSRLWEVVR